MPGFCGLGLRWGGRSRLVAGGGKPGMLRGSKLFCHVFSHKWIKWMEFNSKIKHHACGFIATVPHSQNLSEISMVFFATKHLESPLVSFFSGREGSVFQDSWDFISRWPQATIVWASNVLSVISVNQCPFWNPNNWMFQAKDAKGNGVKHEKKDGSLPWTWLFFGHFWSSLTGDPDCTIFPGSDTPRTAKISQEWTIPSIPNWGLASGAFHTTATGAMLRKRYKESPQNDGTRMARWSRNLSRCRRS